MSFLLAAALAASTFLSGETLDYELKWLRITGGSARMTVSELDEGRIRITSVGKSSPGFSRIFKVRDEIETIVSKEDFSTLKYTKNIDEDGDKKIEVTTVEDGVATRRRKKVKSVKVPRPVFDPISLIYHLRTLDLSVGKHHKFTVVADAKVYNVDAVVVRRETLTTPAGKFNCIVVEPKMDAGGVAREERLWIWYSDDERRLPVRIRTEVNFGAITATLRGVTSSVGSIEPPVLKEAR
jgi:Protein of unknown function (DUF3108)